MVDPRLYESDTYVVLAPGVAEEFLTTAELATKLRSLLATRQDDLPRDLQGLATVEEQAIALLENACEVEIAPGERLQWYAVRLEK